MIIISDNEFESTNSKPKREKGNNLLEVIDNYVVFDIETTGLDPYYDEIIEIGAIKVKGSIVVDTFQTLIKPKEEISPFITRLTGITNTMVENAPSIEESISIFLEFVGKKIVVGHNVSFDINFVYDYSDGNFKNDYIDTMRLSRYLFKDFANHKLATLVKNFDIHTEAYHRAMADCESTRQCFEYIKKHLQEKSIDISSLKRKHIPSFRASDIHATVTEFNEDNPFYNKIIAFTGVLERMERKEAMQIVTNLGATCKDTVTKQTNYLVLGNNDYCPLIKGGKSTKQKKAEDLIQKGYDLSILSENVFYDMLNDIEDDKD